jgi:PAS domain-containing protein
MSEEAKSIVNLRNFIIGVAVVVISSATTIYTSSGDRDAKRIDALYAQMNEIEAKAKEDRLEFWKQLAIAKDESDQWRTKYHAVFIEKVLLEARLAEKHTVERFIADMPFPAWVKERGTDGIFRFVTINKLFTQMFGLSESQVLGKSDYDLFELGLAKAYQNGDIKVAESGLVFRDTLMLQTVNGLVEGDYVKFNINAIKTSQAVGGMILD